MRVLLFIIVVLSISCNQKDEGKISKYFDVANYFQEEAQRLTVGNYYLSKTLITNGNKEVVKLDSVNWEDILKPFQSCDINKSSWQNSYTIDSTFYDNGLSVIYLASEKNLPVQQIILIKTKEQITSIEIRKEKKSFYFSSSESFIYKPTGYIIKGSRNVRFAEESKFEISGMFIKN